MFYNYSDIAFGAYSEYWRQMRKICILEMLSAKNVKSFGYIRAEEMDGAVESMRSQSGEPLNFTEMIFMMTCAVTCRVRESVEGPGDVYKAAEEDGHHGCYELFPSIKILNLVSKNKAKLLKMRDEMDAILDPAVEEHRLNKSGEFEGEDIVDVLLRMQKNKELQFPITFPEKCLTYLVHRLFFCGTQEGITKVQNLSQNACEWRRI